MGLGKKLSTLINAVLRGGLPRPSRRHDDFAGDAELQLEAVRKALAEVQAKEQAVAEQLKAAQDRLQAAIENNDSAEIRRQRQLTNQLETHLTSQMTEAVVLSDRLAEIESVLTQQASASQPPSATDASSKQTTEASATPDARLADPDPASTPKEDEASNTGDDTDLDSRKSRLSG